jgi:hypothetical protein
MAAFAQALGKSLPGAAGVRALDVAARLARLDRIARLLDSAWGIPGTRFRFGFDALADVVPVVGQIAPHAISAFIVYEAWKLGAPRALIAKMVGNIAIDTAIGVVPAAGMIGDAFFKANLRNVALLKRHLGAV